MNRATSAPRATRRRAAVAALLARTDEFRSAQDLHAKLRRDGDGIGLTVEIEARDVERWAKRTAEAHGFSEASHTVEIYGTCRACGPSA